MSNPFIGLTTAQLTALQSAYADCLTAIASNQSYALNGRSLTRANLPDVQRTLGMINAALAVANGNTATTTFVAFNA